MSVGVDPLVGSDLAGYRLERVLGRGGMGVVYLAADVRLERPVALKLVAPELASDSRFRERFLREARAAASFDHSHVVPVHAAGETDGQLWLAMRFVEGEDLAAVLEREGQLAPERAVGLCAQVGEALDAAHARGLVHRDVKPANVLVTVEGGREHAYLTDFGLARDVDADRGAPTHLSGSVDYTAPEQVAHEPLDGRADVYSLGCVLYECLAGEPPFRRPRPMATLFAHASEPPPSLHDRRPELPAAIDAVIVRALAKEPGDRYDTAKALTDAVGDALGLGHHPRFTRRRLLLFAGAAAAAIAATAAIPLILAGGEEPGPKVALPVTVNTLLRIDPRSGEPVAGIPLGEDPTNLAAGEGSVWVVDSREHTLLRVDAKRDAVVDRVDISRIWPLELFAGDERVGVGAGTVWLSSSIDTPRTWKYDHDARSLTEFARTGLEWVGEDGVWLYGDDHTITRRDATTGGTLETIAREWGSLTWTAVAHESVWLWSTAFDAVGVVEAVDRRTGVLASVDTGLRTIDDLALGEGAVWALGGGDSLVRIDADTRRADRPIRVGRSADSVAVGEGYVWVGSSRDETLTRVDPETSDLLTVDVGGQPRGIAVAEGDVWVIVRPS